MSKIDDYAKRTKRYMATIKARMDDEFARMHGAPERVRKIGAIMAATRVRKHETLTAIYDRMGEV